MSEINLDDDDDDDDEWIWQHNRHSQIGNSKRPVSCHLAQFWSMAWRMWIRQITVQSTPLHKYQISA